LIARGAAAGVYFEAEFLAEREPSALATVTLRIYPDSARPTLGGVRFFHAAPQDLIPGSAGLMALGNGYESSSPTACVDLASASDLTSHGTLGLTRGPTGLGLAFDALDSGDGTLSFTAGALEATSRFTPIRPLRPIGDTASLRLCYEPVGDGLS